jgi:hypothetical protein
MTWGKANRTSSNLSDQLTAHFAALEIVHHDSAAVGDDKFLISLEKGDGRGRSRYGDLRFFCFNVPDLN